MRSLFFILFLTISTSVNSQSLQEVFSRTNAYIPRSSNSNNTYTFKFYLDNTFEYLISETSFSMPMMQHKTRHSSSISGTYTISNDTIKIITTEKPTDSFYYPKSLLIDTIRHRIIDLRTLINFKDNNIVIDTKKAFETNKRIALIDTINHDTTFYYVPVDRKTGKAPLTIDYAIRNFTALDFLKAVVFRTDTLSRLKLSIFDNYDSIGRLVFHYLAGWPNMSSIPWTIELEYIGNTKLLKKVSHSEQITHGDWNFQGTYQTFSYDDNGSMNQINFFSNKNELVKSYQILK